MAFADSMIADVIKLGIQLDFYPSQVNLSHLAQ